MKHLDLDLDSRAHHHGIKLAPFERSYFYQVTFTKCSKQWFCAKKKHWQISVGNANCVKRLCFLRGMGTPGVCHGDAVSRTDRGRCSAIGYLPPAVAGTEKSLFQGKVACPRGGGVWPGALPQGLVKDWEICVGGCQIAAVWSKPRTTSTPKTSQWAPAIIWGPLWHRQWGDKVGVSRVLKQIMVGVKGACRRASGRYRVISIQEPYYVVARAPSLPAIAAAARYLRAQFGCRQALLDYCVVGGWPPATRRSLGQRSSRPGSGSPSSRGFFFPAMGASGRPGTDPGPNPSPDSPSKNQTFI